MDISKTELQVMQAIWQGSPVNAEQVIERLNESKPWHEKTVKTLLNRLVKKKALDFNKVGRQYAYFPLISEQSYQEQESQSFVSRLFKGRVSPLIAGFAKQEKLTKDDVDELKKLIADWEQKHD